MAAIEMSEDSDEGDVTYSSPDINVLSNTLDSSGLVEVSSYDTFPAISAFDHSGIRKGTGQYPNLYRRTVLASSESS
jgi:hypothetical protein